MFLQQRNEQMLVSDAFNVSRETLLLTEEFLSTGSV